METPPVDPALQREAYNTVMASLLASLATWTAAPTVPEDFDPARPYILTPGCGLSLRPTETAPGHYEGTHLEPGNLAALAVSEVFARRALPQLGRPWSIVPVTAIRDALIEELTGTIEHLKTFAPPTEE